VQDTGATSNRTIWCKINIWWELFVPEQHDGSLKIWRSMIESFLSACSKDGVHSDASSVQVD